MTLFKGIISNHQPVVSAIINENGRLNLVPDGKYQFVVDTGFTGDVAVPFNLLTKLNLKFIGYEEFELATQKVILLPVFHGWVKVKGVRRRVRIVPGDELLGMGILERIGSRLIADFDEAEVKLFG